MERQMINISIETMILQILFRVLRSTLQGTSLMASCMLPEEGLGYNLGLSLFFFDEKQEFTTRSL